MSAVVRGPVPTCGEGEKCKEEGEEWSRRSQHSRRSFVIIINHPFPRPMPPLLLPSVVSSSFPHAPLLIPIMYGVWTTHSEVKIRKWNIWEK
jgi:hypothetical protein